MEIGTMVQFITDKGAISPLLVTDVIDSETVSGLLFGGKTPTEKKGVTKESDKLKKDCWRHIPGTAGAREPKPLDYPRLMTHQEAKVESPAQIRHRLAQEEFEKNQANSKEKVVTSRNLGG